MGYLRTTPDAETHEYLLNFAMTVDFVAKDVQDFLDLTGLLLKHVIFEDVFKDHFSFFCYTGQKMTFKEYTDLLLEVRYVKTVPILSTIKEKLRVLPLRDWMKMIKTEKANAAQQDSNNVVSFLKELSKTSDGHHSKYASDLAPYLLTDMRKTHHQVSGVFDITKLAPNNK